jgi:hypothetical protein
VLKRPFVHICLSFKPYPICKTAHLTKWATVCIWTLGIILYYFNLIKLTFNMNSHLQSVEASFCTHTSFKSYPICKKLLTWLNVFEHCGIRFCFDWFYFMGYRRNLNHKKPCVQCRLKLEEMHIVSVLLNTSLVWVMTVKTLRCIWRMVWTKYDQ